MGTNHTNYDIISELLAKQTILLDKPSTANKVNQLSFPLMCVTDIKLVASSLKHFEQSLQEIDASQTVPNLNKQSLLSGHHTKFKTVHMHCEMKSVCA